MVIFLQPCMGLIVFKKIRIKHMKYWILVFLYLLPIVSFSNTSEQIEIHYTNPLMHKKTGDLSISHKFLNYIQMAAPGSIITASIYAADNNHLNIAHSLVKASKEKNISVNIVFDSSGETDPEYKQFAKIVKDGITNGQIKICHPGGCIGKRKNHNKFFLFSELIEPKTQKKIKNTVLQSSYNLNKIQDRQYEDLIIMKDNNYIYKAYSKYWKDLYSNVKNPNYMSTSNGRSPENKNSKIKVFFSPSKKTDPLLDELKKITCTKNTSIILGQANIQDNRGEAFLNLLIDLKRKGCQITILYAYLTKTFNPALKESGITNYRFTEEENHLLHTKITLIDSAQTGGKVVWTGSANLKDNSLHNDDDTMLRIKDDQVYGQYYKFLMGLIKAESLN